MTVRLRGTVLPVLLSTVLLTGCGGGEGEVAGTDAGTPDATRYPVPDRDSADPCLTAEERSEVVTFRSGNGALLAGVRFGTGDAGVVLVHMSDGTLCNWAESARWIADQGATAFAFDLNGAGLSQMSDDFWDARRYEEDVAAAVRTLKDSGVASVALAGASLGGTLAVVTGADLGDDVTAVAAVSGAADFEDLHAVEAAAGLDVPLLCIAGADDGDFAADAQRICDAATAAPSHEVVILPDNDLHGTHLLNPVENPDAPEILAGLEALLTGTAPPQA